MKTIVKCCCCEKPAVDDKGKSKKSPICWNCIKHGGSVERKCSIHERVGSLMEKPPNLKDLGSNPSRMANPDCETCEGNGWGGTMMCPDCDGPPE